ncbi:MAG: hypothetical protein Kow0099_10140 [Candidatus Abyssubacteria bacterium]
MSSLKKLLPEQARAIKKAGACVAIALSFVIVSCAEKSPSQPDAPEQAGATHRQALPVQVEGWQPASEPIWFRGEGLFDHINGGADIYFEYGFVELAVQRHASEEKTVSVEAYRMSDPAAAYGIYSYNRHPSLATTEAGDGGVIHANGLFFWQDDYYVDIRQIGGTEIPPDDFKAFARAVEANIGAHAQPPHIMNLLPAEHMLANSQVFARGRLAINNQVYISDEDVFGLGKNDAAAIARYKLSEAEFPLIIARYAEDSACAKAFDRLRTQFPDAQGLKKNEFVVKAAPGKFHIVRRSGSQLIVAANAESDQSALEMINRID